MACGASCPRVGAEDRAPAQHHRLGGGAHSPTNTRRRWTVRRQFGARMRGLVAVLAAAVTLTLLPSGTSQAQSAGGTWATKAPMLTVRTNPGVTTAGNGKTYAIGGGNATSGYLSANEEYDAASNAWTARAPMPTPRQGLGVAAAANGKLYAIGGIGFVAPTPASTVVEEYDPATNMWAPRAAMPTGRAALGLAAAPNGKLYAMGGYNDSGALATVEEYDPATNSWAAKAPMPTPRLGLAVATASNGKLYAI